MNRQIRIWDERNALWSVYVCSFINKFKFFLNINAQSYLLYLIPHNTKMDLK